MDQFLVSTANLATNQEDEFLMVKEGKEHVYGKRDFPRGRLEEEESPEKDVVRENIEETGFNTSPNYLVSIYLEKSQRTGNTALFFLYKSEITGKVSDCPEEGKILDHDFFRFSRVTEHDLRKPNRHRMLADCLKGQKKSTKTVKDTRSMD